MSRLLLRPLGLPCTGAGAGATAARRDFPAKRPAPQQKEGTSTPTDSGDGTDTGPALVPSAGPDKRHHRRRQRGRRLGATTEPRTAGVGDAGCGVPGRSAVGMALRCQRTPPLPRPHGRCHTTPHCRRRCCCPFVDAQCRGGGGGRGRCEAPNRFGNLLQPPTYPLLGPPLKSLPFQCIPASPLDRRAHSRAAVTPPGLRGGDGRGHSFSFGQGAGHPLHNRRWLSSSLHWGTAGWG